MWWIGLWYVCRPLLPEIAAHLVPAPNPVVRSLTVVVNLLHMGEEAGAVHVGRSSAPRKPLVPAFHFNEPQTRRLPKVRWEEKGQGRGWMEKSDVEVRKASRKTINGKNSRARRSFVDDADDARIIHDCSSRLHNSSPDRNQGWSSISGMGVRAATAVVATQIVWSTRRRSDDSSHFLKYMVQMDGDGNLPQDLRCKQNLSLPTHVRYQKRRGGLRKLTYTAAVPPRSRHCWGDVISHHAAGDRRVQTEQLGDGPLDVVVGCSHDPPLLWLPGL